MKLLLLIVSGIAVFDANCRNFPDLSDSVNGAQNLPDEDHNSANEDQYVNNEPGNYDSADEDEYAPAKLESHGSSKNVQQLKKRTLHTTDESEEPDYYDSADEDKYAPAELESHGSSKNVQQLKIRTLHTTDESEEPHDLDSDKEYQDLEKEEKGQIGRKIRKSRCKAKNICVVMGGFCVTNATLCSGRLVAKGCKGPDCQCCVPESFKNQIHNLTNEIKSLQTNLSGTILKMNMKLELMEDNFTDSISNISSNLDHNIESTGTFKNNLTNEIKNMQSNLNGSKVNMDSKLKLLEDKIMNSISKINSKLSTLGCPQGFFSAGSLQCFKYFNTTKLSWTSAKAKCQSEGLVIAKPNDVVALNSQIKDHDGGWNIWIEPRGTGSLFKWDCDGQFISNSNSFWQSGHPGSYVSTSYCLAIAASDSQPKSSVFAFSCSNTRPFVCEQL